MDKKNCQQQMFCDVVVGMCSVHPHFVHHVQPKIDQVDGSL